MAELVVLLSSGPGDLVDLIHVHRYSGRVVPRPESSLPVPDLWYHELEADPVFNVLGVR